MKRFIGTIDLPKDMVVNRIIVNALISEGYEVMSDVAYHENRFIMHETINIYHISENHY